MLFGEYIQCHLGDYRDTLLLKLDVNNTAAMVSKALKLGLVH